jgi:hypothetical protein
LVVTGVDNTGVTLSNGLVYQHYDLVASNGEQDVSRQKSIIDSESKIKQLLPQAKAGIAVGHGSI